MPASRCQQACSKPCLVNLISKDTHLVFSISRSFVCLVGVAACVLVSHPLAAMNWSLVCDCGFSWPSFFFYLLPHRVGGNRKRYQQSTNADQKSIETVFSIPICRQCGDKWQSKTLFLFIFDLRSSIVLAFTIATYPVRLHRITILISEQLRFSERSTKFVQIMIVGCS